MIPIGVDDFAERCEIVGHLTVQSRWTILDLPCQHGDDTTIKNATACKLFFAILASIFFLASPATAQYTWDVTKPVENNAQSIAGFDIEVSVSWITQMSTAVSQIDVEVLVNGINRAGDTLSASSTPSTSGSGATQSSKLTLKEKLKIKTQNTSGAATVKFIAKSVTGKELDTKKVEITLKP